VRSNAAAAQRFGLLAADRGGALVEAVIQDAGVKRLGQVRQHPPQPRGAGDHAGQVAELASDAGELGVDAGARVFGVFEDAEEWWVERRCGC
jgi:hypothetical protein